MLLSLTVLSVTSIELSLFYNFTIFLSLKYRALCATQDHYHFVNNAFAVTCVYALLSILSHLQTFEYL